MAFVAFYLGFNVVIGQCGECENENVKMPIHKKRFSNSRIKALLLSWS